AVGAQRDRRARRACGDSPGVLALTPLSLLSGLPARVLDIPDGIRYTRAPMEPASALCAVERRSGARDEVSRRGETEPQRWRGVDQTAPRERLDRTGSPGPGASAAVVFFTFHRI